MAMITVNEFVHCITIFNDEGERYYIKSTINEQNNTILMQLSNLKCSWAGMLNEEQIRMLAKKFPSESNDSFYSHTQRAFTKGNSTEIDGKAYAFSCKILDKNRLEFIWKEKIEALNSLKIIGSIELHERSNEEMLSKIIDYNIGEIETLRSENEQKLDQIQCLHGQLNKALETVKRTVDLKEQLEADLYRKFVLVLNAKKAELSKLKYQIELYQNEHSMKDNVIESYNDTHSTGKTPVYETTWDDMNQSISKRRRCNTSNTDDSDEEDMYNVRVSTKSKSKIVDNNQDGSLDLGDDQIDYKTTTINKHHQGRNYVTTINSISTRPFVDPNNVSSTMTTPCLPDDSQTTNDLLNNI